MKKPIAMILLALSVACLSACPITISTGNVSPNQSNAPSSQKFDYEYLPFFVQERMDYEVFSDGSKLGTMSFYITSISKNSKGETMAGYRVAYNLLSQGTTVVSVSTGSYKLTGDQIVDIDQDGKASIMLKIPLKLNASWTDEKNQETKVVAQESVKVPAGDYGNAFKLSGKTAEGQQQILWLAKDVGLVKAETMTPNGLMSIQLVKVSQGAMDIPTPSPTGSPDNASPSANTCCE